MSAGAHVGTLRIGGRGGGGHRVPYAGSAYTGDRRAPNSVALARKGLPTTRLCIERPVMAMPEDTVHC